MLKLKPEGRGAQGQVSQWECGYITPSPYYQDKIIALDK